jgi:hypothetical protein
VVGRTNACELESTTLQWVEMRVELQEQRMNEGKTSNECLTLREASDNVNGCEGNKHKHATSATELDHMMRWWRRVRCEVRWDCAHAYVGLWMWNVMCVRKSSCVHSRV